MKTYFLFLPALIFMAHSSPLHALAPLGDSITRSEAEDAVEQMRGFSMQPAAAAASDGRPDSAEQRRLAVMGQFQSMGKKAVPALAHALKDHDMQMRRNATLVLLDLAGGLSGGPKVDIREAMRALIKATGDFDSDVRAWAAQALGEIGPDDKAAVPALLKMITDPDEGSRNSSCIALGDIGPAAKDALPALRKALNDPSKDVRQFAKHAIEKIERK